MAEIIINLTADEEQAIGEMLGAKTIEEYLKQIAQNCIAKNVEVEWDNKTLAEKQTLLGS